MIYSRTINETDLFRDIKNLGDWKEDKETVFWYDQHDRLQRYLEFNKFIDPIHWKYLKENLDSKILIFYGDEYFNLNDVEAWAEVIKNYKINPFQIYLITIDENYSQWAKERLLELGITGVNIVSFNNLLRKTKTVITSNSITTHKFSSLSRNYNTWRLDLFANLYKKNLLENFNYTFNNVNPYSQPIEIISHTNILSDLKKLGHDPAELKSWVQKMPYSFSETSSNKWDDRIYKTILEADIHLLVESHYDPYRHFWNYKKKIKPNIFSPAFLTEKTYKVIMCKKPFIAFTTPYFMEEIENLGFKRFSKYIDESYDRIEDNKLRLNAIVSEIERISSLNKDDYYNLITNCKEVCNWNYRRLLTLKKNVNFRDKFDWINQYITLSKDYDVFNLFQLVEERK